MKGLMEKKLLFVVNPGSGSKSKRQDQLIPLIKNFCSKNFHAHRIYETSGKDDQEKIRSLIAEYKPDTIAVAGGDGTVNMVSSLILNTAITLAIIPLGSANGLAKDLKIPADPAQALNLIKEGRMHAIDTLIINGQNCFHISDLGYNARIVRRFASSLMRGKFLYIWYGLMEFFTLKPFHYQLSHDGKKIEGNAFMMTITNANRFGTNVNINPLGENDDGYFEISIFKPFRKFKSLAILYRLLRHTIYKSKYNHVIHCRKATIDNIENASFHIDGEPVQLSESIQVKILSRALKVIVPKEAGSGKK
jgi:diacylglycerol kinase (ATP)